MTDVKLSICIPTYNRAPYLRFLLESFLEQKDLGFSYELVISDNASPDDTGAVAEEFAAKGLPIRYFRRDVNGGGWPNLLNAYQNAIGRYAMHLADDDLLIFDGLRATIEYLDANPDVTVCHAPWYLHDAVMGKDEKLFYAVDKPRRFEQRKFGPLLGFILEGHVFPEIAVYRADVLRTVMVPRDFCYWAFSYIAQALDLGPVAFVDKPFYRSVTHSPVALNRDQAGLEETMTAWDRYRGGIEYLIYMAERHGQLDLSGDKRSKLAQACGEFTAIRMSVAMRLWAARKEFIKAYELYTRICLAGLDKHPDILRLKEQLPLMASLQILARKVNAVSGLRYLVLDAFPDVRTVGGVLKELGLDPAIEVIATPENPTAEIADAAAVVTSKHSRREILVKQGFRPGLVFSESDLVRGIVV